MKDMAPTFAHFVSLSAPPRGPLRLRPGKAGSAAPACEEFGLGGR